jgi:hypothetical protein
VVDVWHAEGASKEDERADYRNVTDDTTTEKKT